MLFVTTKQNTKSLTLSVKGQDDEVNVTLLQKTSRYACSGFSLIGFYLVTVLEEANVALPPLQVIFIIMVTASLS